MSSSFAVVVILPRPLSVCESTLLSTAVPVSDGGLHRRFAMALGLRSRLRRALQQAEVRRTLSKREAV